MYTEMETIWGEAVVTSLKVLSSHLPGGTMEHDKKSRSR
jgi:hypothetical protein